MGVVTTVVLGTLDRNQLNAEVSLASRQSVLGMAAGADGFAAAYASLASALPGTLTPSSPAAAALLTVVRGLAGLSRPQAAARLGSAGAGRAAVQRDGKRLADGARGLAHGRAERHGVGQGDTAAGPAVLIVGRTSGAASANLRGVVLTELITGGALIALLAVCGNWLIGRGLAPLRKMASTAA